LNSLIKKGESEVDAISVSIHQHRIIKGDLLRNISLMKLPVFTDDALTCKK